MDYVLWTGALLAFMLIGGAILRRYNVDLKNDAPPGTSGPYGTGIDGGGGGH